MIRKCRSVRVLIASDGKEFEDTDEGRAECQKNEDEIRSPYRLRERLRELVSAMNRFKRSGPAFYHLGSLSTLQLNMRGAKDRLLEAAKGKRRHTYDFATSIENAAHEYLVRRKMYDEALAEFNAARYEFAQVKKEIQEKEQSEKK